MVVKKIYRDQEKMLKRRKSDEMKRGEANRYFLISLLLIANCLSLVAEEADKGLFEGKTQISNPFALRDPFKSPLVIEVARDDKTESTGILRDGVFTNIQNMSQEVSIYDIKVVGVLIGKERRAMVKIGQGDTFVIKEGMKLGRDQVELKAILPGGLIFVEKLINVYGQAEYLETVIPVSATNI